MDGQNSADNLTSANTNASIQNVEQPAKAEDKPQQNSQQPQQQLQQNQQQQQQQQQAVNSSTEQATNPYIYATSMQRNVASVNESQQQTAITVQQNLSSTYNESPLGQKQSQLEQQPQEHQPQMPPYHPPIKPLLTDDSTITIPPQSNAIESIQAQDQKQENLTSQKNIITKVKLSDELNIFDWFRTKEIISQIAEKAKNSVDSVITTLDPGMKEYLYSGGNINVVVISDNDCLISPVRDAFQSVFGRATVASARYSPPSSPYSYPIRIACALQEAIIVAQEKIKRLRQDTNSVPQNQVVLAVQPTLVSMSITSNPKLTESNCNHSDSSTETATLKWFFTYCMLIEDPVLNVTLNCYSQFIPIDTDIVESAKAVQLPADFPDKHLGFAGTIDELMAYKLRLNPNNGFRDEYGCFWLREWAGIYETQMISQLSLTLAQSYRRKWNDCAHLDTVS